MIRAFILILCMSHISCSGLASFAISAGGNVAGDFIGKKIAASDECSEESDD